MPKSKIILVASHSPDVEVYLNHFQAYDVDVQVVANFKEAEKFLVGDAFNGIVVDLKTKLSVAQEEKMLAHDLLEHYPVMQSRILPDSDQIQAMPFGKSQGDASWESFFNIECPDFGARKIRSAIRRHLHFNVFLSVDGSFAPERTERTFTLDMSRNGCFIVTSNSLPDQTSVPFIIKELAVATPIVGEIRWIVPWGRHMQIPGFGVRFEDIQASQHKELVEKYNLH